MKTLANGCQPKVGGNRVSIPFHEGGWYFENLLAVVANDLGLLGTLLPVGHVVLQVRANIDLARKTALDEYGKGAIDGSSGNRAVDQPCLV